MIAVRRGVIRTPDQMQQEMEQLFRTLLPVRPGMTGRRVSAWRPQMEVYETEDALVVDMEIAGADERALQIVIEGDVLRIAGERPDRTAAPKRRYREAGIIYGPFAAEVYIPFQVDVDHVEASYDAGFLRITLPRVAPRTIVPGQGGPARQAQEVSNGQ